MRLVRAACSPTSPGARGIQGPESTRDCWQQKVPSPPHSAIFGLLSKAGAAGGSL